MAKNTESQQQWENIFNLSKGWQTYKKNVFYKY